MPMLLLVLLVTGQIANVRVMRDPSAPPPSVELPMGVPDLCAGSPENVAAGQIVVFSGPMSKTCVGIHGTVTIAGSLLVTTILVYPDGALILQPDAQVVIRDAPIDTALDPEQFGHGLVVFGRVSASGVLKTPFERVTAAVPAGVSTVMLQTPPVGWQLGDEVVIPESKPRGLWGSATFQARSTATWKSYDDRRRIVALSGATVTLSSPVTWDHPGAADKAGATVLFPHVVNLTRSIVIRSENPNGVRGHSIFMTRANVNLQGVEFKDMGRTTNANLDCTGGGETLSGGNCTGIGSPSKIGKNQRGRYACHIHFLLGPVNATNTGYQFSLVGNSVHDSLKWPLTIHESSYGFVKDNVVAYGQGAGIMFENGNEHFNVLDGNFITGMDSTGDPREQEGRESSGIWLKGSTNNTITNNVVAGLWNGWQQIVNEVGYKYLIPASGLVLKRPKFRGADLDNPNDYTLVNAREQPILRFDGNEAYGLACGFTIWHSNTDGYLITGSAPSTISRLTVWNMWEEGVFAYPAASWIFDQLTVRGSTQSFHDPDGVPPGTLYGFTDGDYKVNNITVSNAVMSNVEVGISADMGWDGAFKIIGGDLHAKVGITVKSFATPGAMASPIADRMLTITDTTFSAIAGAPFTSIMKLRSPPANSFPNLPERVRVVNYNGELGDSFFLYYLEQATQNISGGLAPCTTRRVDITALVCGT